MPDTNEERAWKAEIDLADWPKLQEIKKYCANRMSQAGRPRRYKRSRAQWEALKKWRRIKEYCLDRLSDPRWQSREADAMGRVMAHAYTSEIEKLQKEIAAGMQVPQKYLNVSMSTNHELRRPQVSGSGDRLVLRYPGARGLAEALEAVEEESAQEGQGFDPTHRSGAGAAAGQDP